MSNRMGSTTMERGWICGSSESLSKWVDQPNEMARHWRNTEGFGRLVKQECGWVSLIKVVFFGWTSKALNVARNMNDLKTYGFRWVKSIPFALVDCPSGIGAFRMVVDECCLRLQAHEFPSRVGGTRWAGGARLIVDGGRRWEDEIQAIAQQQGWSVTWSVMTPIMVPKRGIGCYRRRFGSSHRR